GGNIVVYWGQGGSDNSEGSLKEACKSGHYNMIVLEELITYDNGRDPDLNLGAHCVNCTSLQQEIKYCQLKLIKILLQIGQVTPTKEDTKDTTKDLSQYLDSNFFSGKSGPLGEVYLDGIDIASVPEGLNLKFDELVQALNDSATSRRIYLSASPNCVYPDYYLDKAIQTQKLDFLFVQFFYALPCIYTQGLPEDLFQAMKTWTSNVPESKIFMALPATPDLNGYIPPRVLNKEILPAVTQASNFAGVMIFDRYFDRFRKYSSKIKR
uniref:Chitinase like lectin n=1 Tax=Tamarindus indica TaxID=58860 RepID=S4S1V9_TAMIN|nr:Chain A, CHITINASE LIKE LECTIN [Tamarindus indica]4B16_A Chain A, CHITINASE LIKE LECTIN [Tamarindus indica]